MAKNTGKKLAVGTIIGAVTGFIAGILTAPKSGKETRQDIKNAATESIASTEKELKKIHSQLTDAIELAKKNLEKANGKVKEELESAIKSATRARSKASQILSSVHEPESYDEDLEKAVNEARDAVKHLKAFLKKP